MQNSKMTHFVITRRPVALLQNFPFFVDSDTRNHNFSHVFQASDNIVCIYIWPLALCPVCENFIASKEGNYGTK
jgi:hypothetical protein